MQRMNNTIFNKTQQMHTRIERDENAIINEKNEERNYEYSAFTYVLDKSVVLQ